MQRERCFDLSNPPDAAIDHRVNLTHLLRGYNVSKFHNITNESGFKMYKDDEVNILALVSDRSQKARRGSGNVSSAWPKSNFNRVSVNLIKC